MANLNLKINNKEYNVDIDPQMPLLWAIRDIIGLKGTKFGCGIAQCGTCTVLMDKTAIRSCVTTVASAANREIVTIEGLSENGDHPLQEAWVKHDVPQCGYCQAGQIMNAAGLLNSNPNPSDEEIEMAMNGNICRCGTYLRIKEAIKTASKS